MNQVQVGWDPAVVGNWPLRDYQKEGIEFLCTHRRCGLVDEPGLGKTMQILGSIVCSGGLSGTTVIFAPKSAQGVWRDEIIKWLGAVYVDGGATIFYRGTPKQREKMWAQNEVQSASFVITSYQMATEMGFNFGRLNKRGQPKWNLQTVVCDEYHRAGLLNTKTGTYKAMKILVIRSGAKFLVVSGTPYTKGPQDFFGLFRLFDPQHPDFRSYWHFVNLHCVLLENGFGYTEIHPRPKDAVVFRALVEKYFLRRHKRDVLAQLPDKIRQVIPIEMTKKQAKMYETLEKDLILQLRGKTTIALSPLTLSMRLRQLLVSPKCLDKTEAELGAGVAALVEMVDTDFDAGDSVLVFTPFASGMYIIEEALRAQLKCTTFLIHGGLAKNILPSDVANDFQKCKTIRKAIISTIKTGQAWTATAANVVYFLGYEWAAIENLQAEDRAHRIGQHRLVTCKYIKHVGTVDEDVLRVILEKELGFAASLDVTTFLKNIENRRKLTK